MNDEEMVSKNEAEETAKTDDPLPPQDEEGGVGGCEAHASLNDREDISALSDADAENPDPASSEADQASSEDRLECLRNELTQLRAEIAARDELLARIGGECEEFRMLYPDTALSALPDSIWEDVRRGIPIAAAWALSERRRMLTAQKAEEYNRLNDARSSGALTGTEPDYFSPTEVRAMTQSEVRANYQKIMRSMQKWH